jgi:hypothetical protein
LWIVGVGIITTSDKDDNFLRVGSETARTEFFGDNGLEGIQDISFSIAATSTTNFVDGRIDVGSGWIEGKVTSGGLIEPIDSKLNIGRRNCETFDEGGSKVTFCLKIGVVCFLWGFKQQSDIQGAATNWSGCTGGSWRSWDTTGSLRGTKGNIGKGVNSSIIPDNLERGLVCIIHQSNGGRTIRKGSSRTGIPSRLASDGGVRGAPVLGSVVVKQLRLARCGILGDRFTTTGTKRITLSTLMCRSTIGVVSEVGCTVGSWGGCNGCDK